MFCKGNKGMWPLLYLGGALFFLTGCSSSTFVPDKTLLTTPPHVEERPPQELDTPPQAAQGEKS